MSEHGFLVARRGEPAATPWKVGDRTDVYELLDPLDLMEADPVGPDERAVGWDSHSFACAQSDRLAPALKRREIREDRRHRCTCEARTSIATEVIDELGNRWVMVGPERIPSAFRRTSLHDPARRAMPMHIHPNGSIHVEFTTCRRCNQDWAVGIGSTRVQIARVKPTRGGTVQP